MRGSRKMTSESESPLSAVLEGDSSHVDDHGGEVPHKQIGKSFLQLDTVFSEADTRDTGVDYGTQSVRGYSNDQEMVMSQHREIPQVLPPKRSTKRASTVRLEETPPAAPAPSSALPSPPVGSIRFNPTSTRQ